MGGVSQGAAAGTRILVALVFVVGLTAEPTPILEKCTKIDACRCRTDTDHIIDLSPLDSTDPSKPAFMDYPVSSNSTNSTDKFSWNPCTPFCEMHCEGAATCQIRNETWEYHNIGVHSNAEFATNYSYREVNVSGLFIKYNYTQSDVTRYSVVQLVCNKDVESQLFAYGEIYGGGSVHYFFRLVSEYACPRDVPPPPSTAVPPTMPSCPKPWISTTPAATYPPSVISWEVWLTMACLSVPIVILLYLVIGITVNLGRGRQGVALIPNYQCWLAVCRCDYSQEREERKLLLNE